LVTEALESKERKERKVNNLVLHKVSFPAETPYSSRNSNGSSMDCSTNSKVARTAAVRTAVATPATTSSGSQRGQQKQRQSFSSSGGGG
jgi:hypothetical protein